MDLVIAIDLVQRESHRHAHWLIPDVHWLERADLFALLSQMQELPFVQYAPKAIEPPAEVHEAWEFFVDVALAMRVPLFGKRGVNGFVKLTRALARATGRRKEAVARVRLLPGVAGNESSLAEESFAAGLLEYPHYTRPRVFEGHEIPEILLSGDHEKIVKWRREQAEKITKIRRPDLWQKRKPR